MSDPTSLRPGNDAPAAPAAPSSKAARAVVAAAAGTSVNPFDREEYAGATSKGYGDAMGRGLELALTVLVFGGIGLWIDHVAGTSPVFAIALSLFGCIGIGVKLYLGYDLDMRKAEDGKAWTRDTEGLPEVELPAAPADPTVGAASDVATLLAAEAAAEAERLAAALAEDDAALAAEAAERAAEEARS